MIRVTNVFKQFDTETDPVEVLRGVSLTVDAGTSIALTGESGSGKSTLLHLIAGLDTPTAGDITAQFGNDPKVSIAQSSESERARIRCQSFGIVFQQFNLIPSLTNWQNLIFGARLSGRFDEDWCRSLADHLGLNEILLRYPDQISGGQQQRLAVARAFAARPRLVLADEPTGNLDEDNGDKVLGLAFDLVQESGSALLIATHSDKVARFADTRLHLDHGQLS